MLLAECQAHISTVRETTQAAGKDVTALIPYGCPHTTWVAGHSHKLPPCVLRTNSNPLSKSLYPNINKLELPHSWIHGGDLQVQVTYMVRSTLE